MNLLVLPSRPDLTNALLNIWAYILTIALQNLPRKTEALTGAKCQQIHINSQDVQQLHTGVMARVRSHTFGQIMFESS